MTSVTVQFRMASASPHGCFRAGQRTEVGESAAAELVASGVAEYVEPLPAAPEVATLAASETATRPAARARRRLVREGD